MSHRITGQARIGLLSNKYVPSEGVGTLCTYKHMTTGRINQVAVSSSTTRVRLGNRAPPTSAQLVRDGCVQLALKRSGSGSRGCRPLPRESGSFRSPIDQQQQRAGFKTRPSRTWDSVPNQHDRRSTTCRCYPAWESAPRSTFNPSEARIVATIDFRSTTRRCYPAWAIWH